jgi:hypothetical protein
VEVMKNKVTAIENTLQVIECAQDPDNSNVWWLVVPCVGGYDTMKHLPAGVVYGGREYGKTGWNSDKDVAYYSTSKSFARKVGW